MVLQARSLREQLGKLTATGAVQDSIKALDGKLSALLDGPKDSTAELEPALSANNSTVIALYKEVEKADATPTAAQQEAFQKTSSALAEQLKRWDELKTGDVAALNQREEPIGFADSGGQRRVLEPLTKFEKQTSPPRSLREPHFPRRGIALNYNPDRAAS